MNSQAGLGVIFFANGRMPVHLGYRFMHISNGGTSGRNEGLEVHQAIIGVRVRRLR
jgi:opacity protein-like surface antigen